MAYISNITLPDKRSFQVRDDSAISDISIVKDTLTYTKRDGSTQDVEIPVSSDKVGYAEYSDGYLYLYESSQKANEIAKIYLGSGGTSSGITETRCKEIVESYGYVTTNTFETVLSGYAKTSDIHTVSVTQLLKEGTEIAKITVDGTTKTIFAPEGGGGGAVDSVNSKTGDVVLYGSDIAVTKDSEDTISGAIEEINGDIFYTNSNPSTVDCGGIKKGTTFSNESLKSIIENMLYPYVAFVFSSVSGGGTYEYGTTVDVKTVTPSFTSGSKSLSSVKVGTTSGGSNLYDGTTCTSGTALSLSTTKTYDGTTGGTIYMTISDGTTTTTKSTSVGYSYYDYALLNSSTTAPTSGGTKNRNDYTYSYSSGQYLWILSHSIFDGKLQTYVAGSWADVSTTASGSVTFTMASGATATYYAYRTDQFSATGSARYRLISK